MTVGPRRYEGTATTPCLPICEVTSSPSFRIPRRAGPRSFLPETTTRMGVQLRTVLQIGEVLLSQIFGSAAPVPAPPSG